MSQHIFRIKRRYVGHYVFVGEGWISNGHWMVRRDRVLNGDLFLSKTVAQQWLGSDLDWRWSGATKFAAIFKAPVKPFTVTRVTMPWSFQDVSRLLVGDGDRAWVDDAYITMAGLQERDVLYAKDGQSPLQDGETVNDSTFVLMPQRYTDDKVITDLKRWLLPRAGTVQAEEPATATSASAAP